MFPRPLLPTRATYLHASIPNDPRQISGDPLFIVCHCILSLFLYPETLLYSQPLPFARIRASALLLSDARTLELRYSVFEDAI